MPPTNKNLTTAVENYFADLQRIRASGGSTAELSSYGPLANLLNSIGGALRPNLGGPALSMSAHPVNTS